MCGVLAITIDEFNEGDHDLIRGLFRQSMIRGKHATGVSYVKNEIVNTIKEPIPADEFIKKQNLNSWRNEDGNLYCIGHIRYSTSDLNYNQPMASDELSIVHNGVITQEPKERWRNLFGFETETANDSELILRQLESGKGHPLKTFRPASMAVCTIDNDKVITAFRNEERPLYYYSDSRMTIFASTADILKRAGLNNIEKTEMYRVYMAADFTLMSIGMSVPDNIEDLQ
jgi:glutamine phosphoribosylpyrophosphate amidotransferase